MKLFQKIPRNTKGRTFVIGDLHGHYHLLMKALDTIGFDFENDILLSCGDLVDRGPNSDLIDRLIGQPWFRCVRGNHEQMLLENDWEDHGRIQNGAAWWVCLNNTEKMELRALIGTLPVAIEIETAKGKIGIVHAEVVGGDWAKMESMLADWVKYTVNQIIWERSRWRTDKYGPVDNVDHVIVGHTSHREVQYSHNVIDLDTGCGYEGGRLTVMDLDTLEIVFQERCPPPRKEIHYEGWMR